MVKAENIYTAEHFKAAYKTGIKGKKPYVAIYSMLLFTIAFSGLILARLIKAVNACRYPDAYILAVCGFLCLSFGFKIVKALVNSNETFEKAASKQHIRHFEIDGNELVQFTDSEIEHSERRFIMSGLAKAYDTGSFFVIYLYEDMYCIIGYSDITEGSPAELRSLLYSAIGDRLNVRQ